MTSAPGRERVGPERGTLRVLVLCPIAPPQHRYGTELVADDLQEIWSEAGLSVFRTGPVSADMPCEAWMEGAVAVHPLPPRASLTRRQIFERQSPPVPRLEDLLARLQPDIAVVVGFGAGAIDLSHLETLKSDGIPIVLWHHVPGVTCQQTGLRYKDREPCDGTVIAQRCAACRLTAAGVPETVADLASRVRVGGWEDRLPRGLNHVVAGRDLSERFARSVARLRELLDHVFVGADWVREVLLRNGFADARITRVRPGLREALAAALSGRGDRPSSSPGALRLSFWGRLDPTKGVETAIRAISAIPDAPLLLRIAGDAPLHAPYPDHLRSLAGNDPRIRFVGRLDPAGLIDLLADSDAAIVPSTWMETGPLTVFEAHAAGLPLLGSDVGGIGELARGDPSARVFARDDHAALAGLILELLDPAVVARRRALVPRGRTMRDAAYEMLPILEDLGYARRRPHALAKAGIS